LLRAPLAIFQYQFYRAIGVLWYFHREHKRLVNGVFGGFALLGVLTILRCSSLEEEWHLLFENGAAGIWGVSTKGALLILLVVAFRLLRKLLTRRYFARLSRSSYTLYLFHYPMLCVIFSIFHLDYLGWDVLSRGVFLLVITCGIVIACHVLAVPLENKTAWLSRMDRIRARWKATALADHKT
tara:strand:- start:5285 stop:5833 length:549 start_codon:yes stop_codon:yes gene_type:complete